MCLGPPKHCTRFRARSRWRRCTARSGRSDEADAMMRGSVRMVSTAPFAVDDIEDAGRQARFQEQFACASDGGVALDGLRMKALPQACGAHSRADHRREVERVMPATTPSAVASNRGRCRDRHPRCIRPSSDGDAAGELHNLDAALISPLESAASCHARREQGGSESIFPDSSRN